MEQSSTSITATLRGIRPILFDRYGGDNKTQLAVMDKLYLNERGECGVPILKVFSLLSAQNTPSVAKRFYGKQGRDVALGVQSFVNIEAAEGDDPLFAPLKDDKGKVYTKSDKRIRQVNHVARLKDGIPNTKERPMIPTGWMIKLKFDIQANTMLNLATLKRMMEQGGILGLGTFRPIFGRYTIEWTEAS
jgi:hypothetical protein